MKCPEKSFSNKKIKIKNLNKEPSLKLISEEKDIFGIDSNKATKNFITNSNMMKKYRNGTKLKTKIERLTDCQQNLLTNQEFTKTLKTIHKAVNIEELRAAEDKETFDSSFTEKSSYDLAEQIVFGEATDSEKEQKTIKLKSNRKSSLGSINSINITQKYLREEIKSVLNRLNFNKVIPLKNFFLGMMLLFGIIFRARISGMLTSLEENSVVFESLMKSSYPFGFFLKESAKMNLDQKLVFDRGQIRTKNIYDETFLKDMYNRLRVGYKWTYDNSAQLMNSELFELELRDKKNLNSSIENIGFVSVNYQIMQEAFHLTKEYNPNTDKFSELGYKGQKANTKNLLAMFEKSLDYLKFYEEIVEKKLKDYFFYFVLFGGFISIFAIIISLFLYSLSVKITNETTAMGSLLRNLDKTELCKAQQINQRVKKVFMTPLVSEDKKENNFSEKEKKNRKKEIIKKNRSSSVLLINLPKTKNSTILIFSIVSLIMFIIPLALDLYIQRISANKYIELNSVGIIVKKLGSSLLGFYGLFYLKYDELGTNSSQIPNLKKILEKVQKLIETKDSLQFEIVSIPNNDYKPNSSICEYLELTQINKKLCQIAIHDQPNFNIFLAMSEVYNYYLKTVSVVNSENFLKVFSNIEFRRKDLLVYYLTLSLSKLYENVVKRQKKILKRMKLLSIVFYFSFFTVIFLYYLTYSLKWKHSRMQTLKQLQKTYLILPNSLLAKNSYIKSYFGKNRTRGIN